jgi:hypothetical protein
MKRSENDLGKVGVDFTQAELEFIYYAVKNVDPDYRSENLEFKLSQLL